MPATHAHPHPHTWTHMYTPAYMDTHTQHMHTHTHNTRTYAYTHTHTHTDPASILGLQREVLLVLQWINFQHEPSDLHLLFTGDLYTKMVALAGVVTTKVTRKTVNTTFNRLNYRVRCACVMTMQLLGLTVG